MNITFGELAALGIGGLFTVTGIRKRNDRIKLMDGGLRATGEVVRLEEVPSSDNSPNIYKPVIQFTAKNKQVVTKAVEISTYPCPYKVGQKMVLFYDRDNAEHFALDDGPQISLEITFFAIGIVALVIAAVLFITTEG